MSVRRLQSSDLPCVLCGAVSWAQGQPEVARDSKCLTRELPAKKVKESAFDCFLWGRAMHLEAIWLRLHKKVDRERPGRERERGKGSCFSLLVLIAHLGNLFCIKNKSSETVLRHRWLVSSPAGVSS